MDNGVLNGLGGLSHGSFFRVNDSVDTSKPPGMTVSDTPPESLRETSRKILIGESFCYSPNLTWFLMAVGAWYIFPYDLESSSSSPAATTTTTTSNINHEIQIQIRDVVLERFVINNGLALTYIAFSHWILYFRGICNRPFVPNRVYNIQKVLHNIFYTLLGIFQWTVVEGAFIYLYRTGKLPYIDATTNLTTLLQTLLLSIALPSFRDIHFYFAHRLIHVRCLYKYIHSLHHRNTDIEPFAGLAMHPVEHMYYYTCYGPLLIVPIVFPNTFPLSPFLLFWMGMHCVITPAASHSGYEDHFSADLIHYLHHRYCECNYSAGINFDSYFGTYRDTLKETATSTKKNSPTNSTDGSSKEQAEPSTPSLPPPPADPKSSLGFPEHPEYQLGTYTLVFGSLYAYHKGIIAAPSVVAFVVPFGPAIWAFLLSVRTAPKSMSWRKVCLAPFDKDSTASLVLHIGMGCVLAVLPISHLLSLVLD